MAGCARELELEVDLVRPAAPDPFVGVERVQMLGRVAGRWYEIGAGRWDQGPLPFERAVDPRLDRLVVIGRGADGGIVASGASGPLALAGPPRAARVEVRFTRVGALSTLSAAGTARASGEALGLEDGRVLLLGGLDEAGCARTGTELWSLDGAQAGPVLPRGRLGAQPLALPSGEVLLLGGEEVEGCSAPRAATDALLLNLDANTVRRVALEAAPPPGAALAVVDDSLVLWAGGVEGAQSSAEVFGVDPRSGALRRLGALDAPRSDSSAIGLEGGRVLVVGGAGAEGVPPHDDASVFVVRRGAALSERVEIGAGVRAPTLGRTRAGGVLVAGGEDAEGVGQRPVRLTVVGDETSVPLGDTSVVSALTRSVGRARLIELQDGSWLLLPRSGDVVAHWLRLLPRGSTPLEGPSGPLVGGLAADGLAQLFGPEGARYAFNPGPAGWLGAELFAGRLAIDPAGPPREGLGIVPLRPGAWSLTTRGLEGQAPIAGRVPTEWAVLPDAAVGDFDLELDVRLGSDAQAALLFGLAEGEFDYVGLAQTAFAGRSAGRAAARPVSCPAVPVDGLVGTGATRVRLTRVGARVALDVGADGDVELACDVSNPTEGAIALGLIRGTVTFDAIDLQIAP